MELDLHGLNVEDATAKIMTALYWFSMDESESELIVITGRGTGTLSMTFHNIMSDEDSFFYEAINDGSYLVKKT